VIRVRCRARRGKTGAVRRLADCVFDPAAPRGAAQRPPAAMNMSTPAEVPVMYTTHSPLQNLITAMNLSTGLSMYIT